MASTSMTDSDSIIDQLIAERDQQALAILAELATNMKSETCSEFIFKLARARVLDFQEKWFPTEQGDSPRECSTEDREPFDGSGYVVGVDRQLQTVTIEPRSMEAMDALARGGRVRLTSEQQDELFEPNVMKG